MVTTTPIPPQSSGPLSHHLMLLRRIPSSADVVIVGDSLAERWPSDELRRVFPQRSVFNFGVSADRTQNTLWRLQNSPVDVLRPSVVLLMLGTNNLGAGDKPCAIVEALGSVLNHIQNVWRAAHTVVVQITPRGSDLRFRHSQRIELNEGIAKLAAERPSVTVLNVDSVVACSPPEVCPSLEPDMLHYTRLGYRLIGQQIAETLNERRKRR